MKAKNKYRKFIPFIIYLAISLAYSSSLIF